MAGDLKIVQLKSKEPVIDDELVLFLEKQLQFAKEGKTIMFTAVVNINCHENDSAEKWWRFIKKSQVMPWSEALAHGDIMNRELQRFHDFVDDIWDD